MANVALSSHAIEALHCMHMRGAIPCQEVNAGVSNKLLAYGLAQIIRAQSPYPTHKGKMIEYLEITARGLTTLRKVKG